MSHEQIFNDLGIDPIRAVEFMGYLDLSVDDMGVPQRYSKFEAVLHYLKSFPDDTQRFLIKKATYNKTADKLNCMFEYVHLLKEKAFYESEGAKLEEQRTAIESSGDLEKQWEHAKMEAINNQKIQSLQSEIEIYHGI